MTVHDAASPPQPGSLLVVGDNEPNGSMLSRELTNAGYEVSVAEGGHKALELARERRFDLVLLDALLPDIGGLEVLAALRSSWSAAELPVIMITGQGGSDEVVRGLSAGANDCVTKPVDVPVVLARIRQLLALKRAIDDNKRLESVLEERNRDLERSNVELARTNAELVTARERAEAASRTKSEFLSNMRHEIRTPMNAIIGMTDLALRSELTSQQRSYLGKVQLAANSLLAILNDILDFSRIEAGKMTLEAVPFELETVLHKVGAVAGRHARQKNLDLLVRCSNAVPAMLVGDPQRLEQVLTNLCNNAVKFTERGEIVLSIEPVAGRAGMLRFSVRDTGIGIAPQHMAQLFQAFSQADSSTTRQHGGTGLGLAISRRLVDLMGGEAGAHSEMGVGSEFFFTAAFGAATGPVPQAPALPANLRRIKVLVLDDSDASAQILVDLLQTLGCQVQRAAESTEAQAELQRGRYDLVLVDWLLGDTDGLSAAEQLRNTAQAAGAKWLLVTAYGDDERRRQAIASKLDGCLAKPVGRRELVDAITSAFEAKSAAAVPADGQSAGSGALRDKRVLLVDDNDLNRIVAGELLRKVAGMDVVVTASANEAFEQLRTRAFDLVLMDVRMPGMDGHQAAAQIRREPRFATLPIIAMTAHATPEDRDQALAAGMSDYVAKPLEPAQLFEVLGRWLA